MLTWTRTNRGFEVGEFFDRYEQKCSIQKSSIAEQDCIWLGCDEPLEPTSHRMHLTREMAGLLAAQLMAFWMTGELMPLEPRETE